MLRSPDVAESVDNDSMADLEQNSNYQSSRRSGNIGDEIEVDVEEYAGLSDHSGKV